MADNYGVNYVEFPWNSQDIIKETLVDGQGLLITTEMITGKIGHGKAIGPSDTSTIAEMLKPVTVELHDLIDAIKYCPF